MRLLITGCAGFIGSRVVALAVRGEHEVVGVDNLNDAYDVRLKEWRLDQISVLPGFTFARLDITDPAAVQAIFTRGPYDAVINLAARAGVRQSVFRPREYVDTNVIGVLNLLEACKEQRVPKFVLASTSALYAGCPLPFSEDQSTDRVLSPYAASKKAAEALAHSYAYLHGLDVAILRYFTVYGPAGRPDMSLFRFVQWMVEERPVVVFGDGRQSRDFTFVDDVAAGTLAALTMKGYEVINLGSDRPVVLLDAIRMIEDLTGKRADIRHEPGHPADLPATWASIERARALLDWQPRISIEDGLNRLVRWYGENRTWASEIDTT